MDAQLIEKYKSGQSLSSLAREYEISSYKVKQFLKSNGINIRNRNQQNFFSNQQRSKSVNDNYFSSIDSPTKAWILGFLAADGCVYKDRNLIKITLSSVDRDILIDIKNELEIVRDVQDSITNKGFAISTLSWSSFQMKKDLEKFNITPRKTYKKLSFANIPEEFKLSYILGYFDGDGCLRKDGRFEICAYSSFLLEEFATFLNPILNTSVKVYSHPSRANYYTITYSYKKANELLEKLYGNNSKLFLKRKYDSFQNIKKPRDYDNH